MTFEKRYDHAMDSPNGRLNALERLELSQLVGAAIRRSVDLARIWELLERDMVSFTIDDIAEYLTTRFPREGRP